MSFRRKRKIETENQHRERWLISYADLVTLLLALFIVMYAASNKEQAKIIAQSFAEQNTGGNGILPEYNAVKSAQTELARKLNQNAILMQKAKIRQTERGLIISLSEAGFFAPGDSVVSAEADNLIESLAETLRDNQANLRVEGHTDSTPISNVRYPSNWELSTARAASVLMRLAERGIQPERLSAAGYGGFQPIADNATADGRALNRRVDVVILNR